jgi:hypothetical protein
MLLIRKEHSLTFSLFAAPCVLQFASLTENFVDGELPFTTSEQQQ